MRIATPSFLSCLLILLIMHNAAAQPGRKLLSHTVTITVEGSPQEFWDFFEPVKLRDIFHRKGRFPAITGTRPDTGQWHVPGTGRTVYFETGHTAYEQITACTVPYYFAYKVSRLTLPARHAVKYAVGQWEISEANGGTQVRWTYTFHHRHLLARWLLKRIVDRDWKPYMEASMERLKTLYAAYRQQ